MTFDPSSLLLFLDVARLMSVSRAAELHQLTQSAVSQRMAQLERRVGVTLLDRSVRPMGLTPAGKRLAQGVPGLLDGWVTLEKSVRHAAQQHAAGADGPDPFTATGVRMSVRVSAINSAGIDLLTKVREQFEDRWPGSTLLIEYDTPHAIRTAVEQAAADVGIVSYPVGRGARRGPGKPAAAVSGRVLWEEPMSVVCPPGHTLTRERSVHARHLGPHEMLAFDDALPVGLAVRDYLASHRVSPRVTHRFDNLDTLKSAVIETGRCAILPRRTVRREVESGALVAVHLVPALCRPMGVLLPHKQHTHTGVDAFLHTLDEELQKRFHHDAGYQRPDTPQQTSPPQDLRGNAA